VTAENSPFLQPEAMPALRSLPIHEELFEKAYRYIKQYYCPVQLCMNLLGPEIGDLSLARAGRTRNVLVGA